MEVDLPDPADGSPREHLRADCARCIALCCVAPAFAASADFALDKPAGRPCPHLAGSACSIHSQLRDRGFSGCTVFDCFGAGQQVVQVTYGGGDWRQDPATAAQMFDVFSVMRSLHELLWYLVDALERPAARPVWPALERARVETERITGEGRDVLVDYDVAAHYRRADPLLVRTSELVRGITPRRLRLRGADLIGHDLRRRHLRGADLRGAYLIGADLRHVDLGFADLIGADLRGADLRGADVSTALFVTQPQVEAGRGDGTTRLPAAVTRPRHWPA